MSDVHDRNRKQKIDFLVEITEMRNQPGRCFIYIGIDLSLKAVYFYLTV